MHYTRTHTGTHFFFLLCSSFTARLRRILHNLHYSDANTWTVLLAFWYKTPVITLFCSQVIAMNLFNPVSWIFMWYIRFLTPVFLWRWLYAYMQTGIRLLIHAFALPLYLHAFNFVYACHFMHMIVCLRTRSAPFACEFPCHSNHLSTSRPTAWLLACSFVPAAAWRSLPRASPTISCSLSCMAHRWTTAGTHSFITAACRETQAHTGRELGVQEDPC